MRDRLATIETQARKLARSGDHRGFASIQAALLEQGFSEAVTVFRNRWTRSELDRLCEQATEHMSRLQGPRQRSQSR
jgi:hypothetical protein